MKFEEENHLGIALIFSVVAILDVTPCATTAQTALRGPTSLRKDSSSINLFSCMIDI